MKVSKLLLAIVPLLMFAVGTLLQYWLLNETLFHQVCAVWLLICGIFELIGTVCCCLKKKSSSLSNQSQFDDQSLNSYRSAHSRLSFQQNYENIELGSLNDSIIEIPRAKSPPRKRLRHETPIPNDIPVSDMVEFGSSTSVNNAEVALFHVKQNIDTPDVELVINPKIQSAIDKAQAAQKQASVSDLSDDVADPVFLNTLQGGVNRWTAEIQKVTKLDRNSESGTRMQEVAFWLNLENALKKIEQQCESEGVRLTLDVLNHASRFLTIMSFRGSVAGLKEVIRLTGFYLGTNDIELSDEPIASSAFDPSTIVKPKLPSFCLTWGLANQDELDAQLVSRLPRTFEAYCDRDDGQMKSQMGHSASFNKFLPHEKLIFNHFFHLFIQFLQDSKAKAYSMMTRTDVIRACIKFANLKNIPTHSNDCWVAGDHLYEDDRYDRPNLSIRRHSTVQIAARVVVQLLHGFKSLYGNNLQAEHYCGFGECLIHVCPATSKYNESRKACHRHGCRAWCQHLPIPCQFQREGRFLPCRSDPGLEKCIDGCKLNCFEKVNQVKFLNAIESRKRPATSDTVQEEAVQEEAVQEETVQEWVGYRETFYADGDIFTYTRANNAMLNFNDHRYSMTSSGGKKVADQDKYNANYNCSYRKQQNCKGKARTRKVVTPGRDWDLEENGFEVTETGEHTC